MYKINLFFKSLFLLFISFSLLNANDALKQEEINQIYFFPKSADKVKDRIENLIKESEESIYISMYNFSYKKFAKKLVKRAKDGIEIVVIFDESKIKKDDKIYKLLKKNDIKVIIADKKLHTKVALFDEKIIMLGSTNWTKKSFKENYEVVLFSKDKKIINDTKKFIKQLY